AKIDGELRDITRPFEGDARLELVTSRDEKDALELVRHDFAHILAEAVQNLFPGTQITFGPATDDGFYYDFAPAQGRGPFTDEDLPAIEEEMRRIIARDEPLVREVWTRDEVRQFFLEQGETFKAEWVMELPADETITMYRSGKWVDLCRGPHLASTGKLDPQAFKLTRVSGAYWRGDQKNAMLSRIYGTGWLNKKQLDAHLVRLEEAAKRDHRKLGQEMDLFHLQSEAQGSVFWHPKGFLVWRQLEAYLRRRLDAAGYDEVKTPQLMDARQWERSGHWGKYRENMFVVPDEIPSTEEEGPVLSGKGDLMALKPMNCPAHVLIFKQGITSYRDLPIRMSEYGVCHRNEPHGALHGIMRVRQFTQDDAHIFCREDQLVSEIVAFCDLLDSVYRDLGFEQYAIKLALRPEQRFGSDEDWDKAEQILREAVEAAGRATPEYGWEELPGEGAFYAPKLEFHLTDAIGRTWQVGTIQADTVLPERLDASYVGEDGERHRPVMLHRAILGTFERFIGILIEHYAGKLPLWLAPVQAVVATIVSDADDYAREVLAALQAAGIRAEADLRNEKINYKVREHSLAKVPNLVVLGKREAEERTVALRPLGTDARQEVLPLDVLVERLRGEATPPDLRSPSPRT
ncbi:MAG TPA: threonine--tRNA ligase, partial [Allosphingosinicella sp.]|nr:threonine--tRNA ligase [Allosphingosinicella sp.]